MTDKTQPEVLRLVEQYDYGDPATYGNVWKTAVCTELRRQHARIAELEQEVAHTDSLLGKANALARIRAHRIVELEAQLEAIGAGGVQALSAAPSSPWSRALEIRMAQGWKLKGDRLPVLYTDTINGEGVGRDDLWLCTTKALAASPTPPAEQQAITSESGAVYAELPDFDSGDEPIWEAVFKWKAANPGPDASKKAMAVESAIINSLRDFADRTHALRIQAATKAAPGEQNAVSAEWLEQAYREGWAACRAADTIGEEAEDWAFGNSTANSRMIDAQQAAPKQEAQEPVATQWLAEMIMSDCGCSTQNQRLLDRIVERITQYDAANTAPQPAPAPLSDDAKDAARYRWLRATTNFATNSQGERIDVRNQPEKWDAAIDAALAAQGGKA